ncbi:potassium-transporting ATPase subunit KdpC [Bacillus changyiensis]|uniref:potassium-transporting ATPase subunit KdpC n=1 Tax=Bacillus changyiensis TaxID=3004103 RepID=UPI0022E4D688|nr:potassium-transporting ATPase subunit KdpC [Bacillus changyiensis]MDA1477348.1 potassium-transporting ATPase subunit KdpC [Bacillus changyiensis]
MKELGTIMRVSLLLMIVCGLAYPLALTGISQVVMPDNSNGSLVYNKKGEVVGSKLIGQSFTEPRFFHGRESSINYDASGSGSPNEAPSNPNFLKRVKIAMQKWEKDNPDVSAKQLPDDVLTNSASGLDPDITPDSARVQIPRISRLTGLTQKELKHLVDQRTEKASLFNEARVNVLLLNIDLQEKLK